VLVLISFVFFIFQGTVQKSLELKSEIITNDVHLLEPRSIYCKSRGGMNLLTQKAEFILATVV